MVNDPTSPANNNNDVAGNSEEKDSLTSDQIRHGCDPQQTQCTFSWIFNVYRVHVESCKVNIFKNFYIVYEKVLYSAHPFKEMVSELSLDGVAFQMVSFTSKFMMVLKYTM